MPSVGGKRRAEKRFLVRWSAPLSGCFFFVLYCLTLPAKSTVKILLSSYFGGLTFIDGHHHTRKLPITEEGLDVILGKAIVLQHSVELLQTLNMMLECDLLLPTACSVQNVPKKKEKVAS